MVCSCTVKPKIMSDENNNQELIRDGDSKGP